MSFRVKNGLLGIATLGLLLLSIGCPNSTPISAGNGSLVPNIQFVNNTTRWDGGFIINQIFLSPSDPDLSAIIEPGRQLGILQIDIYVGLFDPTVDVGFYLPVVLAEGSYDIVGIRINNSSYFDADFDVSGATTCIDSQLFLDPLNNPSINIINFTNQPTVTIAADADTALNLTFDLAAYMAEFEAAWLCSGGVGGTASNFNPTQFANANASYLTID
jgi:hypothetical protein